ncbi:MAG: hypothetical protein HXY42_08830 [Chloroflexi bacterium]|mgnify:CR=1 FL=1|nr:hypothetical protein [Chloroflexota bacterium]
MKENDRFMPDPNRIGLLTSTVLLALALTRFIPSQGYGLEVRFPPLPFAVTLDLATLMNVLVACLTAAGMDWLVRGHPALKDRLTFQWWFLPTLTAFVISIPLSALPGRAWWIGFLLGGVFIFFVFLAEYIVVDPDAPYYTWSVAGLTAISCTLFFILAVALHSNGVRLFILLPALFIAAALASLRILQLWMGGKWQIAWSFGIGMTSVQVAAGLHYWPLTPIQFGLLLIGPLYGLIDLAINLGENMPARRAALEPAVVSALCWGLALFVR